MTKHRSVALLLVVATQILQMIRQLLPLVRFDGYHVLADLTGVPDLYHRIKPTLLGLLPWKWRDREVTVLKPWARAVVTLWVVLVIPLLAFSLLMMVISLPRLLATAWVSLQEQWAVLGDSWTEGDPLAVFARLLAIIALIIPIMGMCYILARLARQVVGSVWRRTSGRPLQRGVSVIMAGAIIAGLLWAWWPGSDTYRPIAAYERGTVTDALPFARSAPGLDTGLVEGQRSQLQTVWPAGSEMPTQDKPGLALIMVPRASQPLTDSAKSGVPTTSSVPDESSTVGTTDPSDPTQQAPSWVFPFDQPLAPEEGDNQALAVNTTDDTVVYDLAFALVWVDDDTVTNTNEAYALASCTNCAAVAVSFQMVLVIGDADVVVPQNVAVAVNYNCVQCLAYALATQLVVTLDGALSDAGMEALDALWAEIAVFAANITEVPLSELRAALAQYEQRILAIIEVDPAATEITATAPSETGETTQPPGSTTTDDTVVTTGISPTPTESSTSSSTTPSESVTPTPTESGTTTTPTEPASSTEVAASTAAAAADASTS